MHDMDITLGKIELPDGTDSVAELIRARGPAAAAAALNGEFAVVRHGDDGTLFAATDLFATHSLCWQQQDGRVRFAARADAFGSRSLDPQALFTYLYAHSIASPHTVYRDVHRLPPGHYAWFDGRTLTVAPYWRAEFKTEPTTGFDQWRTRFRDALLGSVRDSLDGSPPACFLSGGTDSSTVAGHIKQVAGSVTTYSIGFDAQGYDEMEYARIAARHFGAVHREYYVTPSDLVNGIADVAASFDQPFGNSSAVPAYYCALRAREDGVTRLLAGDGGDELFGGNSRYATQRLYGAYGQVPRWMRAGVVEPLFGNALMARTPVLRKGASYLRDAKVPLPDRLEHYNLLLRLGLQHVLAPDFLAAIRPQAPMEQRREVWRDCVADAEIDRNLAFDWRYTLSESDLPKVVGATSLAGVDVGFPMLDRRLLDIALQLPPDYKLRGLKLRWFFKEALRDFLPEAIITKTKKGFGLPFGVWACRDAALGRLAREAVESFATRGIVRQPFVRELFDQLLPAHPGYYGEMVWIQMMLEHWLRRHVPDYRFEG